MTLDNSDFVQAVMRDYNKTVRERRKRRGRELNEYIRPYAPSTRWRTA